MSNKRTFTKKELLDFIKDEINLKDVQSISVKSLKVIADILNIDLSDADIIN